ncbi:homoserine O-acetyltransferase family protein [Nonomuraea salmonea]|uniref:homoserine O-acetyltransferase family protein n=1 Tax=Nonomuraea salmonea TaxID=46181 RepID=UPI0031E63332
MGVVETFHLDLPDPVRLDCGRELHPVRVAYETYGTLSPERDNVILVCHALSGDAHAAGVAKAPPESGTRDGFGAEERDGSSAKGLGWWDGMIGPGKAFDTDRYFVISTNLLGGCRGTTGPSSTDPATGRPYGSDFPVITVGDMVRTQRAFLDALGIERLAAVAGGSLGGMQALEWAISYPDQVDAVVAIASTHALHPQGVAWNAIAREAIMRDPAWQGGHYYGTGRAPDAGMGIGRMVGHITYLSAPALEEKFFPAAAVRRRPALHDHRARVRGGELSASPGRLVRQALRRQHLPLHLARADLLRPRQAARRRVAEAGARGRAGADAADRVQLRLALPAGGLAGHRPGAALSGQAGRVRGDRRAVRPRLLPAGRSAADAHHPPVPCPRRGRVTSRKRHW